MTNPDSIDRFSGTEWMRSYAADHYRSAGLDLSEDSTEKIRIWQDRTRKTLMDVIGISQLTKSPLRVEWIGSVELCDHRRETWVIETNPGCWMPFYILIPLKMAKKAPCCIAPHGHDSGGRLATGHRVDIPAVQNSISKYNYTYGIELVRRGFIVFCPDARGFGSRRAAPFRPLPSEKADEIPAPDRIDNLRCDESGESRTSQEVMISSELSKGAMPIPGTGVYMGSTCRELNNLATSMGLSLTGLWVWDLMRLLDYIETREDCDCENLSVAGLSGGGLQSLWLAALDSRIKKAVVSGYFYGYRDSLLDMPLNCSCNYVPNLWSTVDMGDIGALVAPRPLLVETGDQDELNGARGIQNVVEQVAITEHAYKVLQAESHFQHKIYSGEHRWYGDDAYTFLSQQSMSAVDADQRRQSKNEP